MKSINGIKKNDLVKVKKEYCYLNYSQFIKWHPQYAIRWAYKCYPNESHRFIVKGIYRHIQNDKFDRNKCCVVIQDCVNNQIFLIGEIGLHKVAKVVVEAIKIE